MTPKNSVKLLAVLTVIVLILKFTSVITAGWTLIALGLALGVIGVLVALISEFIDSIGFWSSWRRK